MQVTNKIFISKMLVLSVLRSTFLLGFLSVPSLSKNEIKTNSMSTEAKLYLQEIFKIIKSNSIMKDKIDWKKLENEAFQRAANAQKTSDTYPTINYILDNLGDYHSFFVKPPTSEDRIKEEEDCQTSFGLTKGEILHHKIAYIQLPYFMGQQDQQIYKYALHVRALVKGLAKHKPCGWIIDLRQNGGGNMWPMLEGMAPLLGEGKLGSFINPDGKETRWSHQKGDILIEENVVSSLPPAAQYTLPNNSPVAVLIGPDTASSGEAITVAFKNRPYTRFFGQQTAGLSTSNQTFLLKDGAALYLTTAIFADRLGNLYKEGVLPDEYIIEEKDKGDVPLQKATEWLFEQSECRKLSESP